MKGNTDGVTSKADNTDGSNVVQGIGDDVKALDEQEQVFEDMMLLLASKSNSRYATISRQVQLQATTNPVRLVYACVQFLLNLDNFGLDKKLLLDCTCNSQCEFGVLKEHECSYQILDLLPQPQSQSLDQRSNNSKRVQIPKTVVRSLYYAFWAHSEDIDNEQRKTNNLSDENEVLKWDCNEIWQDFFKRECPKPSVCAAILWHHLRYMPEPIFPYDVYNIIMSLMRNEDFQEDHEEDNGHVYGIVPLAYLKHITKMLSVQRRHSLFQFLSLTHRLLELETNQGQQTDKDDFKDGCYEEDIFDDGEYKRLQEYLQLDGSIAVLIANTATPMLLRPQGVAYMSPLHRQNLPHARMLVLQYIYHFKSLSDILSSTSSAIQEPLEQTLLSNAKIPSQSFKMKANMFDTKKENCSKSYSESKITYSNCLNPDEFVPGTTSKLGTKSYSNLQGNENITGETKNALPFVSYLIQNTVKDILRSGVITNMNYFDHMLSGFITSDNIIAVDDFSAQGAVVIDSDYEVGANVSESGGNDQYESKQNYTYNNTIEENPTVDNITYAAEAHKNSLFEKGKKDLRTDTDKTGLINPVIEGCAGMITKSYNISSPFDNDDDNDKNTTDEDEDIEDTESGPASPETVDDLDDLFLEKPKIVTIDNVLDVQPSCTYRNEELNLNKKQRKQHRRRPITPSIVPSTTRDSNMRLLQNNRDLQKSSSESDLKSRSSIKEASQQLSVYLLESRIEMALRESNNNINVSEQSHNKTPVDIPGLIKPDQMVVEHGLGDNHIARLKNNKVKERELSSPVETNIKESKGSNHNKDFSFGSKQKLELEKKKLKKRLKFFDMEFEQIHGRRPSRIEKEPIRHLYEAYNAIKILLNNNDGTSHPVNSRETNLNFNKPKIKKEIHSAVEVQNLINEKKALQSKLRKFEKMFEEANARKVKFNDDIKGLESDYRRYKDLKTKLQLLREK